MRQMINSIKKIGVLFLFFGLVGCVTENASTENNEKNKAKTAEINVRLGMAYLEQHDYQRSKRKLLLAQQEAPKLPEVWYAMAYFLESTGNKQEAKAYYLKALNLAPKRGDVNNNYGTYLCRMGEYQDAIKRFIIASQDTDYLDPSSAYENAGLCALKIPDDKLAKHYFQLALEQDSTLPVSRGELAKLKKRGV